MGLPGAGQQSPRSTHTHRSARQTHAKQPHTHPECPPDHRDTWGTFADPGQLCSVRLHRTLPTALTSRDHLTRRPSILGTSKDTMQSWEGLDKAVGPGPRRGPCRCLVTWWSRRSPCTEPQLLCNHHRPSGTHTAPPQPGLDCSRMCFLVVDSLVLIHMWC